MNWFTRWRSSRSLEFTAHAPCKPHHYKWFSAVSSTNITWMISFISLKLAYPELPSLHTQSWCEVVLKTWHICRPDLILPSTLSKGNSKEFRLGGARRLITYLCAGGAWGDAAVFKLSSRDMMEISSRFSSIITLYIYIRIASTSYAVWFDPFALSPIESGKCICSSRRSGKWVYPWLPSTKWNLYFSLTSECFYFLCAFIVIIVIFYIMFVLQLVSFCHWKWSQNSYLYAAHHIVWYLLAFLPYCATHLIWIKYRGANRKGKFKRQTAEGKLLFQHWGRRDIFERRMRSA